MNVIKVPITQLVNDPNNARKHGTKNLSAIKGSLAKFGQQKPIVIDAKNVVIAGNGTLEAAKQLGWTHANSGGMTDLYLDSGTYVKSFYSVMYMPSAVKIRLMGFTNKRLHHSVKWENTVPCILREDIKKRA